MSLAILWPMLVVAIGGALMATQTPINGMLARRLGDPILAGAISFGVGFLLLGLVATLRGSLPALAAWREVPVWAWGGGAFGAAFIAAAIWSVDRIGVLSLIAAAVLGQVIAALVLDAIGAFGVPQKPIDLTRLASVALVAAGLVLSRL